MDSNAYVKKESKNRIRVDYEGKLSVKERLVKKFTTSNTWLKILISVFRFIMMLGISFVILYPFIARIAGSFMSMEDVLDPTVNLIPRSPTFDIYKHLAIDNHYFEAFLNTLLLSLLCALIQTFIACLVGYGMAKFKFKGNKLVMIAVVVTMIIPNSTLELSMLQHFINFDLGHVIAWNYNSVLSLFNGGKGIYLMDSYWPLIILSFSGLALKNGLYIYMMRQFFKGVPDELEESAYVDGSGVFRTFIQIILPLSIPMMITIFLFAFSWQWTDEFYTTTFFISKENKMWLMPDIYVNVPNDLLSVTNTSGNATYSVIVRNTAGMMIIAPLVVMYIFCQRYLVQGIERSGLVG